MLVEDSAVDVVMNDVDISVSGNDSVVLAGVGDESVVMLGPESVLAVDALAVLLSRLSVKSVVGTELDDSVGIVSSVDSVAGNTVVDVGGASVGSSSWNSERISSIVIGCP